MSPNELLAAGIAAAATVTFGGLYALFLALGKLRRRQSLHALACMSYLLLAISLLIMSQALRLTVFWNIVLLVLLVAYLVSPHLIWHLTAATHEQGQPPDSTAAEPP